MASVTPSRLTFLIASPMFVLGLTSHGLIIACSTCCEDAPDEKEKQTGLQWGRIAGLTFSRICAFLLRVYGANRPRYACPKRWWDCDASSWSYVSLFIYCRKKDRPAFAASALSSDSSVPSRSSGMSNPQVLACTTNNQTIALKLWFYSFKHVAVRWMGNSVITHGFSSRSEVKDVTLS